MIPDQTFEDIVYEFQDRVYNTCLGFLKNEEDARDAAQNVFIRVYRNMEKFKGESSLGTWIYRIAVNTSLEEIRKSKRKKRITNPMEIDSTLENQNFQTGYFYHPGVELENKERSAILFQAIDQLPELQKVAFTLHKVEGLTYEEVSKVMEKSLSSIESLMHRAKLNLRSKLKEYYEDK
mgnify:CR=1 FL=1